MLHPETMIAKWGENEIRYMSPGVLRRSKDVISIINHDITINDDNYCGMYAIN